MSNTLISRLNKFVQEIEYVSRPDNPGKIYFVKNLFLESSIEDLCFILIQLIEDNENDDSLVRLKDDFKTHLVTIVDSSILENLPIAIEGLAQKYESFLKKIGYLKYKGTEYWSGNDTSAGLTGTTLKLMCEGVLSNKYGKDEFETLKLNEPLINYKGITRSLVDFMRTTLRNAVHNAPNINRKHLIPYSELVLVNYLSAIQDNIKFLGPRYLSRIALGHQIRNTHEKIEESYVKNKLLENPIENLVRLEPRLTESHDSSKGERIKKREGTITEIFSEVNKFVIKGIGGLGKTTTLRFLSIHLIKNESQTPLFFPLRDYRNGSNLIDQILLDSKITINEFETDLLSGKKYVFILDGINEIIDLNKRSELLIELKILLKKYKSCGAVLSSRKIPELTQLELPIFNIQPFDYNGIVEYVEKNYPQLSIGLIPSLNKSERLLRLCSNPLLLQILCSIYHYEDLSITNNEALIIKTFVQQSLERERVKNHKVEIQKISHYLMELGYQTRFKASVTFSQSEAIEILSKCSKYISPGDDIIEVLNLLKDVNFINQPAKDYSFNHELYQEYFAAEGLLYHDIDLQNLQTIVHWRNPILMYSGLSKQRNEFINSVAATDTLLAAECIATSIIEENEIERTIVEKSILSMSNINDITHYNNGVLALLKLRRYTELKESFPKRSKDLGDLVRPREELEGLSIVQTIIKELDNAHLLEFIQLLLDKDISYRNDIVRGLIERDSDELKPIIESIRDLVMNTGFSDINSKNLLNLLTLFGSQILEDERLGIIKKQAFDQILRIKSFNDPAIIIALELDLFADISTICKLIENVPENKKNVGTFLPLICNNIYKSDNQKLQLFKSASISKNLLIYLSGCIYVAQNGHTSAQEYFKTYEVFSNKYLTKIIGQTNRNFDRLLATLEVEILKIYGPYRDFKKLIGKTFSFIMESENGMQITLVSKINNSTTQAVWRGKNALDFLQNNLFQKETVINLIVESVDYFNGLLIVNKKEPKEKLTHVHKLDDKPYMKKEERIKISKETLLGFKLKEALIIKQTNPKD